MFVFNTIVIATHRRSGNQWAIDALRNNSPDISDSFMSLEQIEASHDAGIPLGKFRRQLLNLEGRVLINVHDLPGGDYWTGLDERLFARTILHNSPTIYVHRDGRDVMVSLYYYMRSISETVRNQSFSRFLRGESALAGVSSGMSRPGYWAHHVRSWLKKDNLLAISYDDLEQNYEAAVRKMGDFLAVELTARLEPLTSPGPREDAPPLANMLNRFGIRRRPATQQDGPRLGRSGDWRSLFDRRDLDFFEREAGDSMRQLGYSS